MVENHTFISVCNENFQEYETTTSFFFISRFRKNVALFFSYFVLFLILNMYNVDNYLKLNLRLLYLVRKLKIYVLKEYSINKNNSIKLS